MQSHLQTSINLGVTLFVSASYKQPTNEFSENKSHSGTFITPSKGKINASINASLESKTEDFFAAEELYEFHHFDEITKINLIRSTFSSLERMVTKDFNACVTFIFRQKEEETNRHFISSYTVKYKGTDYKTTLLDSKEDYSCEKTYTNNQYEIIEVQTSVSSLNQVFHVLTSANHILTPSSQAELFNGNITSLQFAFNQTRQPHTTNANSTVLTIPLNQAPDDSCLSAAIFTSHKDTNMTYNVSTFFYLILKEKIRAFLSPEPHLIINKDERIAVQEKQLQFKLTLQKNQLILFKKIYDALYNTQQGLKNTHLFDTPESLYLTASYLDEYVKDEENFYQRRTKAWGLAKKYCQFMKFDDSNEYLDEEPLQQLNNEINQYATDATPFASVFLSKVKHAGNGFYSAFTNLFQSAPNSKEVKTANNNSNNSVVTINPVYR